MRGFGFEQGFEDYDDSIEKTAPGIEVVEAAERWLRARDRSRPFLLYLHFMDVHGAYDAPEELVDRVRGSAGLGESIELSEEMVLDIPSYLREPDWAQGPRSRDLREWRTRYAAGVREFDLYFEGLIELLRAEGVLDSATVIFTSDHGEELYDHGGWNHGEVLFEHELHVPLLIRLPGGVHAGETVTDVVRLIDLFPTLLDAAQLPVASRGPGSSLLKLIGAGGLRRESVGSAVKNNPNLFSLRSGRYKLILDEASDEKRLYDLEVDPRELSDIASREREIAARLGGRLQSHVARVTAQAPERRETARVDAETREMLEALGYVDE